MRSVVVHYHIFKNAGTSVDRLLQEAFGQHWTTFDGPGANDIVSAEQLEVFLNSRPEVRAVSSHQARPPLPSGFDTVPIVFIRHPLDRVESVYEFVRRDPAQPKHELLSRMSLSDFVSWALEGEPGGVIIRDYQTIHLSNASLRAPHIYDAQAEDDDLREAMAFLDSIPVVGVVEQFAESVSMLSKQISERVMPVHFEEWRENISPSRSGNLNQRLEKLRACLSDGQWDALNQANRLDLQLHTFAAKKLALKRVAKP